MPRQQAVTIIASIRSGAEDALSGVVDSMGDGIANGTLIPFQDFPQLHFARLFVVPGANDAAGRPVPASLVLIADIDGPIERFIHDLVERAGEGIDKLFSHGEGYPADGSRSASARRAYLRSHLIQAPATYTNTPGRSVRQIRDESRLREKVEAFLDRSGPALADKSAMEIRTAIRRHVDADPNMGWSKSPAKGPGLFQRIREAAHLVSVPLLLLLLSPVIILGLPIWLLTLRMHEIRDPAPRFKPEAAQVDQLADLEDHIVQNPFTAVGFLKPGRFRLGTARAVLWLVNYGTRHFFTKGQLTGVRTIHFARWILIDGNRRLIFASNYDGSLESYMDEFIDKVAWGLNAVFSNGVGYPKTRFLFWGGAKDEHAFKGYLRAHQIPTRVWYSAYPGLTAINIENNAQIRKGLSGEVDETAAAAWLKRL